MKVKKQNTFLSASLLKAKAGLVVGPLRLSGRNSFGVPSLCKRSLGGVNAGLVVGQKQKLDSKSFHSNLFKTLHNGCLDIEDMHLLFCAHIIGEFYSFCRYSFFYCLGIPN